MAARRVVITTPFPSPASTARVFGLSPKEVRRLTAIVDDYFASHDATRTRRGASAKRRQVRRRAARRR